MKRNQLLAIAPLFLLAALAHSSAQEDKVVVEWVRAHAVHLETPEAGHGFRDIEPLKKIIGNARIVALGEATHGSREFFQLKHRVLEFLATEMGFTIFSIEANMPEAYRLNDYVLNGNGDPAKLLKGMYFWTWDTQEVLDMILWMREFNKSGKGRVEFTGFDMQTPDVAVEIVRDFVVKNDPDYVPAVRLAVDLTRVGARLTWSEVVRHLEANRRAYEAKGAATQDIDWATQNARIVLQCTQLRVKEVSRDQSMADNIKWIADHSPEAKIVVWAHNGHVQTSSYGAYVPMGAFLRKIFGDQMLVFGFAFDRGSFQAVEQGKGLRNFTVPPAPAGSLDATLAAAGIPLLAVDLRQAAKDGPVAAWLGQSHPSRSIGAIYSEDFANRYLVDVKVLDCYDALLFVETTTAARKNPGR